MLSFTPISQSMSRIVNPQSAMMDIPGLSSIIFKKPDSRVSSTSDIEPTNTGDMYEMAPFAYKLEETWRCCGACTDSTSMTVNSGQRVSLKTVRYHL